MTDAHNWNKREILKEFNTLDEAMKCLQELQQNLVVIEVNETLCSDK